MNNVELNICCAFEFGDSVKIIDDERIKIIGFVSAMSSEPLRGTNYFRIGIDDSSSFYKQDAQMYFSHTDKTHNCRAIILEKVNPRY